MTDLWIQDVIQRLAAAAGPADGSTGVAMMETCEHKISFRS